MSSSSSSFNPNSITPPNIHLKNQIYQTKKPSTLSSKCLGSLSKAIATNNLETIKNILDNARTKVTFWGTRAIEVKNYKGSYSLYTLAKKIGKLEFECLRKDNLTLQQRASGIDITDKISTFYDITDTQVKQRNLLTQFFVFIKDFFSSYILKTRSDIKDQIEIDFYYFALFSQKTYETTFGKDLKEDKLPVSSSSSYVSEYKYETYRFDFPRRNIPRILVSKQTIKDFLK